MAAADKFRERQLRCFFFAHAVAEGATMGAFNCTGTRWSLGGIEESFFFIFWEECSVLKLINYAGRV